MNEEYHIESLKEIKKQMPSSNKQFTTIGVIVDCANPHRKDAKKDYCMRLKIIDSSASN